MKFCQFSKITFRAAAVDRQRADERGPRQHFYSNANISIFVIFFLINFLARKSFWLFEFNNEITETASYNMKILYLYRKKPIKPSFWKKNLFERFADCAVEDLLGLETFMSLKIFLQAKKMFPSSSISNLLYLVQIHLFQKSIISSTCWHLYAILQNLFIPNFPLFYYLYRKFLIYHVSFQLVFSCILSEIDASKVQIPQIMTYKSQPRVSRRGTDKLQHSINWLFK